MTLTEAVPHLIKVHSGLMSGMELNERGEELFKRFVSGEVSREEVMAELEQTFARRPPVRV